MLRQGPRQRIALAIALVAVACVSCGGGTGNTGTTGGTGAPGSTGSVVSTPWRPVWSDSFTGPAANGVNRAAWTYAAGRGVFGTGETETMTASAGNVRLDGDGDLDITALKKGGTWTSGRIQTVREFTPPAGSEMMVTATIRQPDPASGQGYWPAFWMLGPGPSPESGEIDIMESIDALSQLSGTFHCGALTNRNKDGTFGPCHEDTGLTSGLVACQGCQTSFHEYSVIIDRRNESDQRISWYLDGHQFLSVSESQVGSSTWARAVDHGFTIILDLAIGGSWPSRICGCNAPIATTSSGGTMSVQNVTVLTN